MNKLGEYLLDFKLKMLLEFNMGWGAIGGIFTNVFIYGTPMEEPSLAHKAYETVLLAGLGGVVGAIGGLLVAILWFFIKKWLKKKYNIEIQDREKI